MRTKVLATTGPRLCEVEHFIDCAADGIYDFRIHLGKNRDNLQFIKNIIEAQKISGKKLNVYVDIPSNRPRIGKIEKTLLQSGSYICFYDSKEKNVKSNIEVSRYIPVDMLDGFIGKLKNNTNLLIKDGNIVLDIIYLNKKGKYFVGKCVKAVTPFESGASCHVRGMNYELLTDETINFIKLLKEHDIEIYGIIFSFSSSSSQILNAKKIISDILNSDSIKYIAKIESREGIKNFESICNVSDAIMIGRGDLAQDIQPYYLPIIQQELIVKAAKMKTKVIVATHFLEKYAHNGYLSAAELNDIWCAIQQGANMIMLSGESGGSPLSKQCMKLLVYLIKEFEKQ